MVLTREHYLKEISNKLALLENSIDFQTPSNLHDLGIIAEDFVRDLLNIIFGFKLENLNSLKFNQAGIDLGDSSNKVAIQITSTTSRQKIKSTIDKFISHQLYQKYSQLYVFLLKKKQQRYKKFDTQGHFIFDESKDIIDFHDLLTRHILHLETTKLKEVYTFILSEIDNNKAESKAFHKLKYSDTVPNKIHFWQYRPFSFHYLNIHRLLTIAAISGLRPSYIPVKNIDEFGSIRALPLDDYLQLITFAVELLENWHPIVLNLQNPDNLTKSNIGCVFEFFQTDFISKNIKFWNRYGEKPKMYGIIKKDPHLYLKVGTNKIYLPINLAWMTTDTSFHNFGLDDGRADCLSGMCILKSISSNGEATFTPLLIGVYNLLAEIQKAVIQDINDIEIRTSW